MPKIGSSSTSQVIVGPYWQTRDKRTVKLYLGDVIGQLRQLASESVQMVITSPPYWGLRDYGTGEWVGGLKNCDHINPIKPSSTYKTRDDLRDEFAANQFGVQYKLICGKCGAKRLDDQIGRERTPQEFVRKMVEVFREVRRVLRDDGIVWLNLGDSYGGSGPMAGNKGGSNRPNGVVDNHRVFQRDSDSNLKSGNLVGIPWRVALALQEDGWILRSDIPWVKRSPMPESVKNRPAKSLEYVFMLVKKMGYFYDEIAVRKEATPTETIVRGKTGSAGQAAGKGIKPTGNGKPGSDNRTGETRNFWQADLWFESVDTPHGLTRLEGEIVGIDATSQGYPGAHFATYPVGLVEPCIRAGTSAYGACADCGAPYKRVTEREQLKRERPNEYVKRTGEEGTGNSCANTVAGVNVKTVGWEPTCECHGKFVTRKGAVLGYGSYHAHEQDGVAYGLRQDGNGPASNPGMPTKEFERTIREYVSEIPLDEHPVSPCVVLDPFIGAGTTCVVAIDLGRDSIGIDLSKKYLDENAIPRIKGALLGRPNLAHLAGHETKKVSIGKSI